MSKKSKKTKVNVKIKVMIVVNQEKSNIDNDLSPSDREFYKLSKDIKNIKESETEDLISEELQEESIIFLNDNEGSINDNDLSPSDREFLKIKKSRNKSKRSL